MQDVDNLKPKSEDEEENALIEAEEKEGEPKMTPLDEPSELHETIPGDEELETMEEAESLLTDEDIPTPAFEAIEPVDVLPPKEEEEAEPIEGKPEESKTRRFFRRLIRWTAGLLIIFGLGLLTGIFAFYQPAIKESRVAIQQLNDEINSKEDQILDLQEQVFDLETQKVELQSYKDLNDFLLTTQEELNLHIAILETRVDVVRASLSVKEGDAAGARIILNKTEETLNLIGNSLEPEQQEVIPPMITRLNLILSEMDNDPETAASDLGKLDDKLLELEDDLFSE